MAALTGGGLRAKPGEVSLAHNGVLFLDELPEFSPQALEFAAPAAGDRRGDGGPGQLPHPLPGQGAAGGGAEPLPLRGRRARAAATAARPRAASRPTRPASPVRCSTASTSPSTSRRSPPPTSPCRRRPRAPPRSPPASPRRADIQADRAGAAGDGGRRAAQRPGRRRLAGDHRRARRARQRAAGPRRRGRRASARGWTRTLRLARTIADLEGAGRGAPRPRRRGADLPQDGSGGRPGRSPLADTVIAVCCVACSAP